MAELIASKVAKTDIINDLITGGETKVLSAEQGKTLKGLVDGKASKSELSGKADAATVTSQLNGKINTSAIKNDLTTGGASNVLSAEQGKTLKGLVDSLTSKVNGKADTGTVTSQLVGKVNTADIINDLTTGGTGKVLSAQQGVVLKGLVDGKADTATVNSKISTSAIKNDLTTGGASNVLSAEQGKTLKKLVDSKVDAVTVNSQLSGKINTSAIKNDLTSGGASNVLSAEQGVTLKGLVDGVSTKLDGKADKIPVSTTVDGLMSAKDKVKLDTIAYGANSYAHPPTHPPSVIAQDATHRFMTDAEKKLIQAWDTFVKSGGQVSGDIILPAGIRLMATPADGITYPLIYQSSSSSDAGRVIVGSSGKTTQIASKTKPEVFLNGKTHEIIVSSDFECRKNSAGGFIKLADSGVMLQWGDFTTPGINLNAEINPQITLPVAFSSATAMVIPYVKKCLSDTGQTLNSEVLIKGVTINSKSAFQVRIRGKEYVSGGVVVGFFAI